MSAACCIERRGRISATAGMEKINRARHFLECVILEQRAATEELRASNSELERLLEQVLATRTELRSLASEDVEESPAQPERPEPIDRSAAELKREAEELLASAAVAIR